MNLLDIGVLARASGLPASTLRYYEERGLIASVARSGLRRQYREETLDQLALIALGKGAGFSLDEIHGMFDQNRQPDLPRPSLQERADELDRQIRRMTTLSKLLRHVAECPAPAHMACPRFRKLLRLAGAVAALKPSTVAAPGTAGKAGRTRGAAIASSS